ncbi:MAG: MjaI family restriction endonuclease [Candidatus Omnitrophota bacterium]|nr:MjaI family restriction endonuclease [Candidatus Omnitrophota bacterium]MDZ4241376.1 MjaI family restriction endonuclease [Candidatus Omnitrophota bacterium]
MAKEWILNSAMNRFQMNFSRNVGSVSEEIRKCSPKAIEEWEKYYFENVRPKGHIEDLGKKLYIKITEVIAAEVEGITEEDCIDYMFQMVINRTYQGYVTEIQTIYGQLAEILKIKMEPASDEWDRLYNVDFFIQIKDKYIGLQIKPAGGVSHISQIFKERSLQASAHEKFTKKYGGKVFYVISVKVGDKKQIQNIEVIDEISAEIKRLSN